MFDFRFDIVCTRGSGSRRRLTVPTPSSRLSDSNKSFLPSIFIYIIYLYHTEDEDHVRFTRASVKMIDFRLLIDFFPTCRPPSSVIIWGHNDFLTHVVDPSILRRSPWGLKCLQFVSLKVCTTTIFYCAFNIFFYVTLPSRRSVTFFTLGCFYP